MLKSLVKLIKNLFKGKSFDKQANSILKTFEIQRDRLVRLQGKIDRDSYIRASNLEKERSKFIRFQTEENLKIEDNGYNFEKIQQTVNKLNEFLF